MDRRFVHMSSDDKIHAAGNGGVYRNFSFGIGESLLPITSRGMQVS